MPEVLIDVEEPDGDVVVIPLAQAMDEYGLDADDLQRINDGKIVWCRDTALSLHKED